MNGISALIKETPENTLAPCILWECSEEAAISDPGGDLSLDIESAGALILDLPAFITMRKKCLFKSLSLSAYGNFVIVAQTQDIEDSEIYIYIYTHTHTYIISY